MTTKTFLFGSLVAGIIVWGLYQAQTAAEERRAGTISASYSGWLGDYLDWNYIDENKGRGSNG
jgi:hypothetical protein